MRPAPNDVKPEPIPAGFEVIKLRWVVERTFAWMWRNRTISRDYELLPATGEALLYVTMNRPMPRKAGDEYGWRLRDGVVDLAG